MFYLLITLSVLCFLVDSHTLSKLQINNDIADVYEIKEDKSTNTVTFTNPKTDQQTLREIVYYHLIERPYGPDKDSTEEDVSPDFDESVRPFTNSHGFPFMESSEKDEAEEKDDDVTKSDEGDSDITKESDSSDDDQDSDSTNEEEEEEEEVIYEYYEEEEEVETERSPVVTPVKTEDTTKKPIDAILEISGQADIITTRPEESSLAENVTMISEVPPSTTSRHAQVEDKAKLARKLLFDRVKDRYNSKINNTQDINSTTTSKRRKREINMHIPDAPRLGPMNYDILPPYLRKMISTEIPILRGDNGVSSKEDDSLEEIRQKMEHMMARLRSKSTDEGSAQLEEKPRTYGMNLTEDHGFVWNEMWTKPGVHFNVDASPGSIEEEQKPDVDINEEIEKSDDKYRNMKDSVEDTHHSEEKREKANEKNDKYRDEDDEQNVADKSNSEEKTSEDMIRRKPKDENKEIKMDELLDNVQFWKWLSDWTSVYIDVLSEHIKETVQEEVANQIKPYLEAHKEENKSTDDKDVPDHIDAKIEANETSEDKGSKTESEKTEKDGDNDKRDDSHNTADDDRVNDEELLKRRGDKENEKKPHNEIEPAKNDLEENKMDTKDKHKDPYKINAQNIYGNVLGSDKVTNIFIFYPNDDTNKIITDIKNDTHIKSPNGITDRLNIEIKNDTETSSSVIEIPIIDERINVSDEDKDETTHNNDKDSNSISTNTTEKEAEKILNSATPVDKFKDEDAPVNVTDSPKDESTKGTPTTKLPEEITTVKPEIVTAKSKNEAEKANEEASTADKDKKEELKDKTDNENVTSTTEAGSDKDSTSTESRATVSTKVETDA